MTPEEIARLQAHLRRQFNNPTMLVVAPQKRGGSVELHVGGEFVGTVHRDAEDGEVSYAINLVVLAEDMV